MQVEPKASETTHLNRGFLSVALNGRFSGTKQPTGTQTVAFHLFDAIIRMPLEISLTIFADSRYPLIDEWKNHPKVKWVEVPFQDWSRPRAKLWEQLVFPALARKYHCFLGHHPISTSPAWNRGVKRVVTLHDLNFALHPDWYHWSFRTFLKLFGLRTLRCADRVVVVSRYVRAQVESHLQIAPSKLRVIYNGVKSLSVSAQPLSDLASVSLSQRYLLCVGSLQPHKNLLRLIQAFQILRKEGLVAELKVVGRPQNCSASDPNLQALLHSPGVTQTGYLGEGELIAAYAGAAVFCYPSLEEGFGLPILEAMMAGTLVVTSNVSCLPEVAGPAATLVDPFSVPDIVRGLRECLTLAGEQCEARVASGKEWASRFTWESAARDYLAIYQEIFQSTLTDSRRNVAVF